ncbi:MAG: UDP-4-amino-4,6-dideoxy-N-acetyl-beta-L-altrosamine transaminase [Bacteroidia bacterium]|nr:UDP-4-amino-4,6-dideoxy-N-acetyl-beta-L-altrosamine transaminase [Bacteroidia bacterium]
MGPIPYAKQYIPQEDKAAILESLSDPFLTTGPRVGEFEKAFAEYIGAPYGIAVANGTAALHLCAKALEVDSASRALCPSLTFAASANCILHEGGEIDFVDIDGETGLIDLDKLQNKLEQAPANHYQLIIAVDFAGFPLQMDRLRKIADTYNCKIIEDSCHAPGAFYLDETNTRHTTGNAAYADLSIFSFHPTKHITTGEGGMITCSDPQLADRLKRLRNHGITKDPELLERQEGGWYYELQEVGLNYRLTDIQARLGLTQLKHAEKWLERRRAIAHAYRKAFANSPIQCLADTAGHAYHLFVIRYERRKELYDFLRSQGIYCQVHYVPLHLHPIYQKKGWKRGDLPQTESYYNSCLSLPMYPSLTEEEQAYVIEKILSFV